MDFILDENLNQSSNMTRILQGTQIELQNVGAESVLRSRRVLDVDPIEEPAAMFAQEANPQEFPDGGLEAYLVVVGSFVGLIAVFGLENSLGAIQSYISIHQLGNMKESTVSWIFSIHMFVLFFGGVVFGGVFDRLGAKIPLTISGILTSAGLLLTAQCNSLPQFIGAFGILTGLGTSIGMQALIAPISHWFLKKRGLACSIATIGGLVGSSVFAVLLQKLYTKIGFQWAMRTLSLIIIACMAVAIVLVKGRNERSIRWTRRKERQNSSEETNSTNILPLGEGQVFGDSNEIHGNVLCEPTPESVHSHNTTKGLFTRSIKFLENLIDFKVCCDPKFISLTLAVSFSELILISTLTYLSSFALTYNISNSVAYALLTIINASGIPSRLLLGWLADVYGRFNVMLVNSICVMISVFALWLPAQGSKTMLFIFSVFFGLSTSAVIALIPACCGQICSSENFGKVYGTMYFFLAFTTLLGVYVSSVVIGDGSQSQYMNLVYFNGALSVAAITSWLWARWCNVGWKWCKY